MNYIKHLTCFFDIIYTDSRLNPNHVSLYMALFQFWNLNRFGNPLKINRSEVMQLSKIGSVNTYHKCLHDLHQYGYIIYIPSFNPLKGSNIHLLKFDISIDTGKPLSDPKPIQALGSNRFKSDTGTGTSPESILKQYKQINNKTDCGENAQSQAQIQNSEIMNSQKQSSINPQKRKRKKNAPKKEKANVPSNLDEVLTFFKQENYPELEARKFFNHFQSNGWKVGGKSPMKDWHAAAHNWILNSGKFSNPAKPGPTNLNPKKRYDIPL